MPSIHGSIRALHAELEEFGPENLDAALNHLWKRLGTLLDAPRWWITIACKDESLPLGWYPSMVLYPADAPRSQEIVQRWFDERDLELSPSVAVAVAGAGRMRALRPRTQMAAAEWQTCFAREDLLGLGLRDRLVGAYPTSERVELYLGFDRAEAGEDFDEEDETTLLLALGSLSRFWRWIALSYGVIPYEDPLTPRERSVLLRLLTGVSEKELAADLGLAEGSIHQVVVRVYRKFRVRSRPELTALWLRGGGRRVAVDHGTSVTKLP